MKNDEKWIFLIYSILTKKMTDQRWKVCAVLGRNGFYVILDYLAHFNGKLFE
jgi:hypothetical protein